MIQVAILAVLLLIAIVLAPWLLGVLAMAVAAYCLAAKELHKEYARLS